MRLRSTFSRFSFVATLITSLFFSAFITPTVSFAKTPPPRRQLICDTQGVPNGWVITQRLVSWTPCGTNVGARWIEKLGAPRVTMCEGESIPASYPAVQFITTSICGTWMASPGNFKNWGAWVLNKVGARRMIICEDQPVPGGYRLTQRLQSTVCGSRFVGNNQWVMRGALLIDKR